MSEKKIKQLRFARVGYLRKKKRVFQNSKDFCSETLSREECIKYRSRFPVTEAKRISLELGGEFGSAAIFPVLPVKLH